MTDERRTKALDTLVAEGRANLAPSVSDARWEAIEARVLARVEQGDASIEAPSRFRKRAVGAAAVVIAVAATVALFVRDESSKPVAHAPAAASPAAAEAGSLRAIEGAGVVRIDGQLASAGRALHAGDAIEVDGTRARLERARRVAWLLEHQDGSPGRARANVTAAGETLVLSLDEGAIEAQVTPVPSGEAFAVDVPTHGSRVRVAVHGTHFRVARTGTRVIVDLSEGVVSIGVPPREGMTQGTLVTAPSHVEFDAADLDSTLSINRSAAAVRPPLARLVPGAGD